MDDKKIQALVDTQAVVKRRTVGDTLGELKCDALVNKLAITLTEDEAKKLRDTLRDFQFKSLVYTLAATHVEVEGETLGDVKAVALVDELPNSLAHVNDETIPHTMRM